MSTWRALGTVGLLLASNTFMTFAWYFHLRQKGWHLALAIGLSWLIALPEYCLQVPANRLGHIAWGGPYSAPQLKIMQEAITLMVFGAFSVWVLKERFRIQEVIAALLILAAVAVAMSGKQPPEPVERSTMAAGGSSHPGGLETSLPP